MPKRCVAANCTNIAGEHVSLFSFPKDQQLRNEWTRQVQRTRANWEGPTATSFVCSDHFVPECFDIVPSLKESLGFKQKNRRVLLPKSVPTEFSRKRGGTPHQSLPKRVSTAAKKLERKRVTSECLTAAQAIPTIVQQTCTDDCINDWVEESIEERMRRLNVSCQTDFKAEKKQTRNVSVSMKCKVKSKGTQTVDMGTPPKVLLSSYTQTDGDDSNTSSENLCEEGPPSENLCEEGPPPSDPDYRPSSSDDSDLTDIDNEDQPFGSALKQEENESPHRANKYIVFFSALLHLLSFCTCPDCGHKDLSFSKREIGTMLIITLDCQACGKTTPWHSQPYLGNIPAGNILLSAGTLFAGASVSKVHRVLSHMGVAVMTPRTFFRHQSGIIYKTIRKVWTEQQTSLLGALQGRERKLICGGDGRADSPGHCAKYGTYTLLELQERVVIDIQLVQSNECGGSYHMEKEGLTRSLNMLRDHHLAVDVLVTDRHRQIAKYIREDHPGTDHLFDIWHVAKGVKTKLRAAARKAGCHDISLWISSIVNHLYWSATSTSAGQGELIEAKWKSVLGHVQNQHRHSSEMFQQCIHDQLEGREARKQWIVPHSRAAAEVEKVINNVNLCRDTRSLSGHHQTSLLEAFHSLLIHFAPKMLVFSYEGMLCRVILAALHFNENTGREQSTSKDGTPRFSLHYPKYKQGGYIVKKVLVPQTFEYVDVLMETMTSMLKDHCNDDLAPPLEVPGPLNTNFNHPDKQDAVLAHVTRFRTT